MNLIRTYNEFKNYDEGVGKNVENSQWIYTDNFVEHSPLLLLIRRV